MRPFFVAHILDGGRAGLHGVASSNPTIPMKEILKTIAVSVIAVVLAEALINRVGLVKKLTGN